jgi:hypothetical protein
MARVTNELQPNEAKISSKPMGRSVVTPIGLGDQSQLPDHRSSRSSARIFKKLTEILVISSFRIIAQEWQNHGRGAQGCHQVLPRERQTSNRHLGMLSLLSQFPCGTEETTHVIQNILSVSLPERPTPLAFSPRDSEMETKG